METFPSTFARENPVFLAIASCLLPSSIRLTIFLESSGNPFSRLSTSSANIATNSGVGSSPATPAIPGEDKSLLQRNTDSPETLPPPRFCVVMLRLVLKAFRSVIMTSSAHRLSRFFRSGTRPSCTARKHESKTDWATSSPSTTRRTRLESLLFARVTSRV
jgi:hypothetical protein